MTQDIIVWKPEWKPEPSYGFEFLIVALAFFTAAYWLNHWAEKGPTYEYENVRILEKYDNWRYLMAKDDGKFTAEFCKDYVPELIPGCVLTKLRYEDRTNCWSVAAPDLGYWYKHNSRGEDVNESGEVCWKGESDAR